MDRYEKYILSLTNKARQQKLSEIEAGIVRSNGQVAELRTENQQQADFLSLAKEQMDSLQTENARLQHIAEESQANAERLQGQADGYCAEYAKQKAENARLKARVSTLEQLLTTPEKGEEEQLQAKVERLEGQIVGYGELLGSANHDVEQLTKYANDLKADNDKLKALARKVVLCFPDKIPEGQKEEVVFNIPAYIIEELREIIALNPKTPEEKE